MPTPRTGDHLRVALVIDDSLDRTDGVQQNVLALGRWLSEHGHVVHYITSHTSRTDLAHVHSVAGSIPVRFNKNVLRIPLPARAKRLREVLAQGRFDVVHVQMPYSPFLAGRLITRLPRTTALVGTFHILPASVLTTVGVRALALLQVRQLRRYDRLVAVSEPAVAYVRENLRRPAVAIANPVPVARFLTDATPVPATDPVLGTAAHPADIRFLGRMVPRKGAGHLLEAVAHLERTTDLHLTLTLGGGGPQLAEFQRRAAQLRSPVSFPGHVSEEDKVGLLAGADVVALPATGGESFGISVVEALACATGPVIAGDNPGYRSVMGPFTDQLVDPADPVAFAGLLERAIRGQAERAALVQRQREHALTFDTDRVARRVVALYRTAIRLRTR